MKHVLAALASLVALGLAVPGAAQAKETRNVGKRSQAASKPAQGKVAKAKPSRKKAASVPGRKSANAASAPAPREEKTASTENAPAPQPVVPPATRRPPGPQSTVTLPDDYRNRTAAPSRPGTDKAD